MMLYLNRKEAGERLAAKLTFLEGEDVAVFALPRGGVVLGREVALKLSAPLGVVIVQKLGHPNNPEYAVGAVAEDMPPVYNEKETRTIDPTWLRSLEQAAHQTIQKRHMLYADAFSLTAARGKHAVLIDDGVATGLSAQAALLAVKQQQPNRVILATPVIAPDSAAVLSQTADELVALDNPYRYMDAVSSYYQRFDQVSDKEVVSILKEIRYNSA